MQMVSSSHSCSSGAGNNLATLDLLPWLHVNLAEVRVQSLQSHAVVDDDAVAVDSEKSGKDDFSFVRGFHFGVADRSEIYAQMCLVVNFLAFVDVIALVAKPGHRLGVCQAEKTPFPERLVGSFSTNIVQPGAIFYPEFPVNSEENAQRAFFIRKILLELRHFSVKKRIGQMNLVLAILSVIRMVWNSHDARITCRIFSDQPRIEVFEFDKIGKCKEATILSVGHFITGKEIVANLDTGLCCRFVYRVKDKICPTSIYVVRNGQQIDTRLASIENILLGNCCGISLSNVVVGSINCI